MAVSFNITEMFNEYVKHDVKYNIENIGDNDFLENLLKTDSIIEKIIRYLTEDEKFLKLLRKQNPLMEEGDEEEIIKELILNEEEWVKEYLYENWNDFLKDADIDELAENFLNYNADYGFFLWDYFVDSELQFETKPFFFNKKLLTEIVPVKFDAEETIDIQGFLVYLKETDEEVSHFLEDLSEYDVPDVFGELSIKVLFNVDSRYYDEELTIECLPNYYMGGYDYENCTDADTFVEEAFGNEENWEAMVEEGKYSEDEIKEKLEYIFNRVMEYAESIEKVYEDIINGNYYNNPEYDKEHLFEEIIDSLKGSCLDLLKNNKKIEFLKEIDKPYNDLRTFLLGHYDKLHHKFKILKKNKNIFTKEEQENLSYLTDRFVSNYDYMKLPEFGNGTYETWNETKNLIVEDDDKSHLFGVRYFKEDDEKLFLSPKKQAETYERIYSGFLDIIKKNKISQIIPLFSKLKKGEEIKTAIAYINYRLFEDYVSKKENKDFFFRYKDVIIEGAHLLSPLYPSEFAVFLITESYGKRNRKTPYQTYFSEKIKKETQKEISKEFKKIADKNSVKKLINKTLALYPYNNDKPDEYKGMLYLKNEFIRPLSLCGNPLKEKADAYTAKEFLSLKLKEMEKTREKADKEIKTKEPGK